MEIYKKIFDSAPVGIIITDAEGIIKYINPFYSDFSGYPGNSLKGQSLTTTHINNQEEDLFNQIIHTLKEGDSWKGEVQGQKRNGALLWEEYNCRPLHSDNGKIEHFLFFISDITERKENESFKTALDQRIRHDLKQPLSPILTFSFLLKKTGKLEAKFIDFVERIETAGKDLTSLIDFSSDLLRMEQGKYVLKSTPVNITEIIFQTLTKEEKRLSDRSLTTDLTLNGQLFSAKDSLWVKGDHRLFQNMFSQLFRNATEASRGENQILIDMIQSDDLVIKIENEGVVPEEIRDVLFKKYLKKPDSSDICLGAYTAKLFADTMGYDVRLTTSDETAKTLVEIKIPADLLAEPN